MSDLNTVDREVLAYVVSHTHWDREWYCPAASFQTRLVRVMDELLALLKDDPEFQSFHLDGQTIVVEDYLRFQPNRREEIARFVSEGRLFTGPWYVAADETLVEGESIVRNLLLGFRDATALGGVSLVGYLPDQFGHIAQMPQILRQFGIKYAVFGRGLNRGEHSNEVRWIAPDGSNVLGVFLNQWYSNAKRIPRGEQAATYVDTAVQAALRHSISGVVLLLNGVDHLAAQTDLSTALNEARQRLAYQIKHGSLQEYCLAMEQRLAAARLRPEDVMGELREDAGGRLDAGTLSARMPLKVLNSQCERLLLDVCEPLVVWAGLNRPAYTGRAQLEAAWRELLQNHPHDSICGCCIDSVAREISTRFERVEAAGTEIARYCLKDIAKDLGLGDEEIPGGFLVWQSQMSESGLIELKLEVPLTEPQRGYLKEKPNLERGVPSTGLRLFDGDGRELSCQVLYERTSERLCLADDELPRVQLVKAVDVLTESPAAGKSLGILQARHGSGGRCRQARVRAGETFIENECLKVMALPDGTVSLFSDVLGCEWSGLHLFEHMVDVGDTYHFVACRDEGRRLSSSAASWRVVRDGPLEAALEAKYVLPVPVSSSERGREVSLRITSCFALRRGERILRVSTRVENNAKDHRLRVLFPLPIKTGELVSSTAFGTVTRPAQPPCVWPLAASTRPQDGWSDVTDGRVGVALLAKGLPEVELLPTSDGCVLALTLLRCVGVLSRQGAVPKTIAVPGAQCQGRYKFDYAIYPHAGDTSDARVWSQYQGYLAQGFVQPLSLSPPGDSAPARLSGWGKGRNLLRCSHPDFMVTAVKPLEPGAADDWDVVVRGVNLGGEAVEVSLASDLKIKGAAKSDLSERAYERWPVKANEVLFTAEPAKIMTWLLSFAK